MKAIFNAMIDDEKQFILGALDTLGNALADHGHQWTTGEKALYDIATNLLTEAPPESDSVDPNYWRDRAKFFEAQARYNADLVKWLERDADGEGWKTDG